MEARSRAGVPPWRLWLDRGAVEDGGAPPSVATAAALAESWEWRALYEAGGDVVSRPMGLAEAAADLAAHLPGLTAAPAFRCASLARVMH